MEPAIGPARDLGRRARTAGDRDRPRSRHRCRAPVVKDPKVAKKWLAAAQQLVAEGRLLHDARASPTTRRRNTRTRSPRTRRRSRPATTSRVYLAARGRRGQARRRRRRVQAPEARRRREAGVKPDVVEEGAGQARRGHRPRSASSRSTITPDGTHDHDRRQGGRRVAAHRAARARCPARTRCRSRPSAIQPKDVEIKVEAGSESRAQDRARAGARSRREAARQRRADDRPTGRRRRRQLPLYVGAGVTGALSSRTRRSPASSRSASTRTFTDPTITKKPSARTRSRAGGRSRTSPTSCLVGSARPPPRSPPTGIVRQAGAARSATRRKVDVVPWVQPEAGGMRCRRLVLASRIDLWRLPDYPDAPGAPIHMMGGGRSRCRRRDAAAAPDPARHVEGRAGRRVGRPRGRRVLRPVVRPRHRQGRRASAAPARATTSSHDDTPPNPARRRR